MQEAYLISGSTSLSALCICTSTLLRASALRCDGCPLKRECYLETISVNCLCVVVDVVIENTFTHMHMHVSIKGVLISTLLISFAQYLMYQV